MGPLALARAWGMNPIQAAAVIGYGGGFGSSLRIDPKRGAALQIQAGLEPIHRDGPTIADEPHQRALIRSCMLHLVRRTQEGPREARVDNLVSGLSETDQQLVNDAFAILQDSLKSSLENMNTVSPDAGIERGI